MKPSPQLAYGKVSNYIEQSQVVPAEAIPDQPTGSWFLDKWAQPKPKEWPSQPVDSQVNK